MLIEKRITEIIGNENVISKYLRRADINVSVKKISTINIRKRDIRINPLMVIDNQKFHRNEYFLSYPHKLEIDVQCIHFQ